MPGFGRWQQSIVIYLDQTQHLFENEPRTIEVLLRHEGVPTHKRQRYGRLRGLWSLRDLGYIKEVRSKMSNGRFELVFELTEKGQDYAVGLRPPERYGFRLPDPPEPAEPFEPVQTAFEVPDSEPRHPGVQG